MPEKSVNDTPDCPGSSYDNRKDGPGTPVKLKDHPVTSLPNNRCDVTGDVSAADVAALCRKLRETNEKLVLNISASFTGSGLKLLLRELLNKGHQISELDKRDSCVDDEELRLIISCVSTTVEKLWLCPSQGDENLRIIDAIRKREKPLQGLYLCDHLLRDRDVTAISHSLFNIEELCLESCDVKPRHVRLLANAIGRLPSPLKLLSLNGNNIGSVGVRSLCEQRCLENIEKLQLTKCGIQTSGVRLLSKAVCKLPNPLKLLDLGNNQLGSRGCEYLSQCLHNIMLLHIDQCLVQPQDVVVLSHAINKLHRPLQELDLSFNPIGARGIRFLSRCINNIAKLILRSCSVLPFDVQVLSEGIDKKLTHLKMVDLRGNPIEDLDSDLLPNNQDVEFLCYPSIQQHKHRLREEEEKQKQLLKAQQQNHMEHEQHMPTVMKSASASIGPHGGCIHIGGCVVSIPPGALDHSVEIHITLSCAPKQVSNKLTPVLLCNPCGLMFNHDIDIVLPVCNVTDGSTSVPVSIQQTRDEKNWSTLKTIQHSTQTRICFQTNRFAGFVAVADTEGHTHIRKTFIIATPVQYATDPDNLRLYCFVFDDNVAANDVGDLTVVHEKLFVIRDNDECVGLKLTSKEVNIPSAELAFEKKSPKCWKTKVDLRKNKTRIYFQEIHYLLHLCSQRFVEDFFFVPQLHKAS